MNKCCNYYSTKAYMHTEILLIEVIHIEAIILSQNKNNTSDGLHLFGVTILKTPGNSDEKILVDGILIRQVDPFKDNKALAL